MKVLWHLHISSLRWAVKDPQYFDMVQLWKSISTRHHSHHDMATSPKITAPLPKGDKCQSFQETAGSPRLSCWAARRFNDQKGFPESDVVRPKLRLEPLPVTTQHSKKHWFGFIARRTCNITHDGSMYAIYMPTLLGVYWWDPWSTIYSSTMDPMGHVTTL